jgi:hypothetical protein
MKKEVLAEFGNLICRFGEEVLVDKLQDIVLPALTDESLERDYGHTSYFFHQVQVVDLGELAGEKMVGVAGRLIKNTKLIREQVFDRERGLVRDSRSLRSSPSSFFLLLLNNHRLIFVKETVDAPSMQTFRATLHAFLKRKHVEHVSSMYEVHKHQESLGMAERVTKKEFQKKFPSPTLELVPLTSNEEISSFVDRFSVLRTIEIVAKERNDELDNKAFFAKMQGMQQEVGSSVTTLKHSSAGGLDPEVAIEQISDATEQGNNVVKLSGLDAEGDKLRGNNEEFQLKRPMEPLGQKVGAAASRLFKNFSSLVEHGLIKVPATPARAAAAVQKILAKADE